MLTAPLQKALDLMHEASTIVDAHLRSLLEPNDGSRDDGKYATRDEIIARLEAAEQIDLATISVQRLDPDHADAFLMRRTDRFGITGWTPVPRGEPLIGRSRRDRSRQ